MALAANFFDWIRDIDGLDVMDGELVCVTADSADHAFFQALSPLLQRVNTALAMDVVFVAQTAEGRPLMRHAGLGTQAEAITADRSHPLEAAYGHKLLESRPVPAPPHVLTRGSAAKPAWTAQVKTVGFLSLPVVGKNGTEYGTVSCRLQPGRDDRGKCPEAQALYSVARLVALALAQREPHPAENLWNSTAAAPLGL